MMFYRSELIFQKKSHHADEYIRMVTSHLNIAINQCVEAASHEFKSENQKMLMKVSIFYKLLFYFQSYLMM